MPVEIKYPGVYVEEIPSGARPIAGVPTSITAFIGRAARGPTDAPGPVHSFGEFERDFGGLWSPSTLGYAVQQFFQNGGSDGLIVRVHNAATFARANPSDGGLPLAAAHEGAWGNVLRARVDVPAVDSATGLFDLSIKDIGTGTIEVFRGLSIDSNHPQFVTAVLAQQSQLIRVDGPVPASTPSANAAAEPGADPFADPTATSFDGGDDGGDITDADISDPGLQHSQRGLWTLDKADLFNLLCIPPLKRTGGDVGKQTWDAAIAYARSRRAFVIVDPAERWAKSGDVLNTDTGVTSMVTGADNAAIYFPRILASDPFDDGAIHSFAPCGVVAGVFARTDANRGVWKAPAGSEAPMQGVAGLSLGGATLNHSPTDADSNQLNPEGINCLRTFPVIGNVVWGARTLDRFASDWKYISTRRLGYYIEESIFRGTNWAVFEPNAEPLWAQLTLDVSTFLHTLFVQGAFQGPSPSQAYFVRCGNDTMTQTDLDNGRLNIEIGITPVRPAEYVIIRIQRIMKE